MNFMDAIRAAGSYSEALDLTIAHFHADSGTIHMLEADGALHLKAASKGLPEAVLAAVRRVPVGKGMAGLAVERAEPVGACNIQTDVSGSVRPGAKATGMEGAVVVPIFEGEAAVGALGIGNRAERNFSSEETGLLIEVGRAIRLAMVRAPEPKAD